VPKPVTERTVVKYLVEQVEKRGGEVRKVKWIGRNSAPDLRVMLPGVSAFWVEAKRPGKDATEAQAREHKRMRALGEHVIVVPNVTKVADIIAAYEQARACHDPSIGAV